MLPATFNRTTQDEDVPKRTATKIYGYLRPLTSEIRENGRRVGRLLSGVWVLCAYYICSIQCAFQDYLHCVEEYLAFCEADVSYEPSLWTKIRCHVAGRYRRKTPVAKGCICGQASRQREESYQQYAGLVLSWLRVNGFHASFDDVTPWKDGTLIWEVLKRASGRGERLSALNSSQRKANWSLVGTWIKSWFPRLIENEVVLHCLVTSESLQMRHVIYILARVMCARRRVKRSWMLRQLVWTSDVLGSFFRPRFSVSGPGIAHAKVGLRNEFSVRTPFPCPPFTVEIQDASGELWRETTENARVIARHNDRYSSDREMGHSDRPADIVKVTMHLYKVFYVIRAKGECKISVMPGINSGGHVYGSPFIVPTEGGILTKQYSQRRISHRRSSLRPTVDDRESSGRRVSNGFTKQAQANGHVTTAEDLNEEQEKPASPPLNGVKALKIRRITTGIARHMSTAVGAVSKAFVRRSWKGTSPCPREDESQRQFKRRTLDTQISLNAKSHIRGGFAAPSSKALKIRNVTVHRYLNLAMPSLEEYFMSKDFSVDDTDKPGLVDAERQERSILRLLRDNMASNGESSPERKSPSKRASLEDPKTRRRIPRLRREENVFTAPWRRSRHSRDGTVRYGSTIRRMSSSSSESGCDVFDDNITSKERHRFSLPSAPAKGIMTRHHSFTSSQPATPSSGSFHFRDIFHSDGGVADLFLEEDPKSLLHVHHHLRRSDSPPKRKPIPATPTYCAPVQGSPRTRRSGCHSVGRLLSGQDSNSNYISAAENVAFSCLDFADKEVNNLLKMAIQEYAKCSPVTS